METDEKKIEELKRNIDGLKKSIEDMDTFMRKHTHTGYDQSSPIGSSSGQLPVGSIYINSSVSTNPSTLLGYGTWQAFGAGKVLVGFDAGQTEFDTAEETGGSKTHTLTIGEMPAHTHDVDTGGQNSGNPKPQAVNNSMGGTVAPAAALSTGGGGAHNNLQPYIVAYFWKRTA